MAVDGEELTTMAEEELASACALAWPELTRITPWSDSFEGFAPSGRTVEVERRYLWATIQRAPSSSRSRSATRPPA